MEESAFNSGQRRLCPDGACVGLIGEDGRCRVCGLQGGAPGPSSDFSGPVAMGEADESDQASDARDASSSASTGVDGSPAEGGGFHAGRLLCPDGACLGVVEADGVCPICGRRAE